MASTIARLRRRVATDGLVKTALIAMGRIGARVAVLPAVLNYKFNPRAVRSDGDLPVNVPLICSELEQAGVAVEEFSISVPAFRSWLQRTSYPAKYQQGYGNHFIEKALEHWVSLQFIGDLTPDTVVIDVANAGSPFPEIMVSQYGCKVYRNDLAFSPGVRQIGPNVWEVGANAANLPLPAHMADAMVLHCALEMFEGDDDCGLVMEARRVLKPGGRLVIVPLYLNERYIIYRDPYRDPRGGRYDPEAAIVWRPHFVRHSRWYNVPAFSRRILANARGMRVTVYVVANATEVDSICEYFCFAAVLEREKENAPHEP